MLKKLLVSFILLISLFSTAYPTTIQMDALTDASSSVATSWYVIGYTGTTAYRFTIASVFGLKFGTLTDGKTCTYASGTGLISCTTDAGLASTITVVDSNAATNYISMFESATGDLAIKTDAGLTYNALTGVLSATGFSGFLTGNVTGTASGNLPLTGGTVTGATIFRNTISFQKADTTPIAVMPSAAPPGTDTATAGIWYCLEDGVTCGWIELQAITGLVEKDGVWTDEQVLCAETGGSYNGAKVCGAKTTDNSNIGAIIKKTGTATVGDATAGTDYTSPSSTETLTNKTFDAAGTGNVLKQKKYLILPSPKRCDETGATLDTTKTNATYGQCLFSASAVYTANWAEYMLTVPEDIDTSVAMQGRFKFQLSGADTGNHCYKIGMYTAANSAAAAYTGSNIISMGFTGDASGASGDIEDTGLVTLTSWAGSLTAGQLFVVRVGRDGGNETDGACGSGAGSTVTSYSGPLVISYTSSQ